MINSSYPSGYMSLWLKVIIPSEAETSWMNAQRTTGGEIQRSTSKQAADSHQRDLHSLFMARDYSGSDIPLSGHLCYSHDRWDLLFDMHDYLEYPRRP